MVIGDDLIDITGAKFSNATTSSNTAVVMKLFAIATCKRWPLSFTRFTCAFFGQIAKMLFQDLDSFYMEQPCVSYEECLTVRKHTDLPFVMDENVNDLKSLVKAWQDHAADVVNIKISKFAGITKAKEAIEFCTTMGIAMTIEDTWGGK